jgi:DNA-binding NarL/FixJ family response regulator
MGTRAILVDILIAHNDDRTRSALRLFLEKDPCLRVVCTAENSQELLQLVRSSRPDLVLLDWRLQGSPAAELVAMLHTADESLKVIVLISRPELRAAAQQVGVHGIINLWEPPQKVLTAILTLRCEDGDVLPKKHGTNSLTVEGDERTPKT